MTKKPVKVKKISAKDAKASKGGKKLAKPVKQNSGKPNRQPFLEKER